MLRNFAKFVMIACIIEFRLIYSAPTVPSQETYRHCEPIDGSACKDIGYNYTLFPNIFKQEKQLYALRELQKYYPLISIQCSPFLREFLCTLYIPPCTEYGFHLPPCRSLCLKARKGCDKLQKFPEKFDCDNFPGSHELMCHSSHADVTYYDPQKWSENSPYEEKEENEKTEAERKVEGDDFPKSEIPPTSSSSSENSQYIQCLNDSECLVTGSVCREGDCICEYPRAWGPLGCQLSQILGGSCESTIECTAVTPNAVCENHSCSCKSPLTSYRNLSCIHGSEVGALCYNDAQCRAINNYSFCRFLVAQVVGTCACDPDQFVNSNGRCVPRLGGRCEKGTCPKELGRSTCKKSESEEFRCRCQRRSRERKGICEKETHE